MGYNVLPIRKLSTTGATALHDGLVVVMFLRKSHAEIAAAVGAALEKHLSFAGPTAARWIHIGEEMQPVTPRRMAASRKHLSDSNTKREYYLTLEGGAGSESDCPDFKFAYQGDDLEQIVREYGRETANSSLELWYPTEMLETPGATAFRDHVLSVASSLPFASGYASLAIHYEEALASGAESIARPLAIRHPGLDLHNTSSTSIYLGDRVRGAYWMTLLGTAAVEKLAADVSELRSALGPEIVVHELPTGVAIQAGERPETGDVNRGDNLPLVRRVAKLIEPITDTPRKKQRFGFDQDAYVAWERRHLQ